MTAHPGFDIEGRIALVTGSSRGIGYALATGLAEARAVVILNGRDADALERSRNEIIDATGGVVHARAFDATSSQQVASAAKHIESEIGPVDIVVNNTGVQHRGPLGFADQEFAAFSTPTSSALLRRTRVRPCDDRPWPGKIINICSCKANWAGQASRRTPRAKVASKSHPRNVRGLGPSRFADQRARARLLRH